MGSGSGCDVLVVGWLGRDTGVGESTAHPGSVSKSQAVERLLFVVADSAVVALPGMKTPTVFPLPVSV